MLGLKFFFFSLFAIMSDPDMSIYVKSPGILLDQLVKWVIMA